MTPTTAYGWSKATMEHVTQAEAAKLGIALCQLRIGNNAGLDAALGGWQRGDCLNQFPGGHTPARSYIGVRTRAKILYHGDEQAARDLAS